MAFAQIIGEAVLMLRMDVVVFASAFLLHWLFVVRGSRCPSKQACDASEGGCSSAAPPAAAPPSVGAAPSGDAAAIAGTRRGSCNSPAEVVVVPLAWHARLLLRQGAHQRALCAELAGRLEDCSTEQVQASLAAMLENLGQAAPAALLECVRSILRGCASAPAARLTVLLLKGYLELHLDSEFHEVLADFDSAGGASRAVSLVVVEAAAAAGDLGAALARLRGCPPLDDSPRGGARDLLRLLLRLACDSRRLPDLLQELTAGKLLQPGAVEVMIDECRRRSDPLSARVVEDAARDEGVELTATALASLISVGDDAERARCIFANAMDQRVSGRCIFVAVATVALKHNDMPLASKVFERLPKRLESEVAALAIRLLLLQSSSHDDVLTFYETRCQGANILPHLDAAVAVADAALQRKRPRVLDRLLAESPDDAPQAALIARLAADRRLKDVQAVFNSGPRKNTCIHNSFLAACIQAEDLDAAERVLSMARQTMAADRKSFHIMLQACCHQAEPGRARRVLDEMRSAGHQPDRTAYTALVEVTASHGQDMAGARSLVEEMRVCGLAPDRGVCHALLGGVGEATAELDLCHVLQVVDQLEEGLDEALLATVLDALVRARRADLVSTRLQRGHPLGIEVRSARCFESMIRACSFVKDADRAQLVWREMLAAGACPEQSTLTSLTEALVRGHGPEAAHSMLGSMLRTKESRSLVTAEAFNLVLDCYIEQGKSNAVWNAYNEMCQERLKLSAGIFNSLIRACCAGRDMWRAPAVLEEMRRQSLHPTTATHALVFSGYCNEDQVDLAYDKFKDLVQIFGVRPNEQMYCALVDCCARCKRLDLGLQLASEMQQANVNMRGPILGSMIKLSALCGRLQTALQLFEEARKHGVALDAQVHHALAQACAAQQASQDHRPAAPCAQQCAPRHRKAARFQAPLAARPAHLA